MNSQTFSCFLLLCLFFQAQLCGSELYRACGSTFSCGNRITGIMHPFRGTRDPPYCGHPSFVLTCDDHTNVTTINIMNTTYRVLEIDQDNGTMTIGRADVIEGTCPTELVNMTLDHKIFDYDASCVNFTFFYGCPASQPDNFISIPCGNRGAYVASGAHGPGICNTSVIVTGTGDGGEGLSYGVVREVLRKGFRVKWKIAVKSCSDCEASKGRCGTDWDTSRTVCYCPHPPYISETCTFSEGSSNLVVLRGMAPFQGPSYSPQSGGAHPPRGVVNHRSGGSNSPVGAIVGGVLGTVTGVIICIIIICCCCRRCCCRRKRANSVDRPNKERNKDVENILLQNGLAPKRYKYSHLKKVTKSFSEKLGKGGYGSVYKGKLPDGTLIAVKILTEVDSDGEEFINEVASISKTSHVNIVTLLGFCYEKNKRALVYEYMPNKSLDNFLGNDADCCLDLKKLFEIAVGIAKGLEYLHSGCTTRIVHFDIKPQNILLDEDFHPKISDFGLAKLCKKKQSVLSVVGTRGTAGYIAPEVFSRNFGGVSYKSDVYSYGMLVLEMGGVNKIDAGKTAQSSDNYFPDKIYEHVIDGVGRKLDDSVVEDAEDFVKKMFLVGFWCIQTNPSDRPSMSKVVEMLEGSVESIKIPPKPTLFSPAPPDHNTSSSFSDSYENPSIIIM